MSRILRITTTSERGAIETSNRLTCPHCILQRDFLKTRDGSVILTIAHERACRMANASGPRRPFVGFA